MADTDFHFVVSAPRSGSTWLANALNQHPEIFATEHRLFGNFCQVWQNNDGTSSPRITFDSYARAFSVHYFFDLPKYTDFLREWTASGTLQPEVANKLSEWLDDVNVRYAVTRNLS